MTLARRHVPLRRLAATALAILGVAGAAFVVLQTTATATETASTAEVGAAEVGAAGVSPAAAGTTVAAASTVDARVTTTPRAKGDPSAYDTRLSPSDCELLGRAYVSGSGCSRTKCLQGAVPFRRTFGAEACALRGQPNGYGFVSTIDVRRCEALSRRWIAEVNYCASEPDRSVSAVYNSAQCTGTASVYVTLTEAEGYYDECLTPERADELADRAGNEGSSLTNETSLRSSTQCSYRPGFVYLVDQCVRDPNTRAAVGGVVMIGDSLTWRGSDELARLRPTFTLDGIPARKLDELKTRLDFFRAGHGEPDGLIIELGTSPSPSFSQRDLTKIVESVPATTEVMLVQPYYELRSNPVVVTRSSIKVASWMTALARSRKHTCVANWPGFVRAHKGILQDGVHMKHPAEGQWARWISQQWGHC
jgi:hypothetical protein